MVAPVIGTAALEELMKTLLALSLVAALAAPTAAQFDLFNWDYTPGGPGSGAGVFGDVLGVVAGFNDPPGFQGLTTTTPVAGTVQFKITWYVPWDGNCFACAPTFNHFGALTTLCGQEGETLTFAVGGNATFGFGLKTTFPTWPATVNFGEFVFTPASGFVYWTDLGQGLGGLLGPPRLAGIGLLHPGMPVKLTIANAAPHQPATLVVGMSALEAPFKGGVLVPAPNLVLPIGFIGMGTLELVTAWPDNLPPGQQLWMQAWIVDPTAPAGLSATNAVLAATP